MSKLLKSLGQGTSLSDVQRGGPPPLAGSDTQAEHPAPPPGAPSQDDQPDHPASSAAPHGQPIQPPSVAAQPEQPPQPAVPPNTAGQPERPAVVGGKPGKKAVSAALAALVPQHEERSIKKHTIELEQAISQRLDRMLDNVPKELTKRRIVEAALDEFMAKYGF